MENTKSINHAISHRIFLVLHANRLSCLITDKHKIPIFFETFVEITSEKMDNLMQTRAYFREIYSSSRLILDLPKYALYPAESYLNEEESALLFKINHRNTVSEQLIELEEDTRVKAICAVDANIYQSLSHVYPGLRIYHHLHYLMSDTHWVHAKGENMAIYLKGQDLTILVKRNQSLLMTNTYQAENEDEIRYFTMLAAEQTGIDALQGKLFIWPSDFDPMVNEWFKPYFEDIERLEPEPTYFQWLSEEEQVLFKNESILHLALSCES